MAGHVIGYVRVSTSEQNTARQLEGVEVDKRFEEAISGKDADRPQLQAMITYAREGDTVIVHSMDRLARSMADLRAIVDQLTGKGVSVRFVKEGLDFAKDERDPMKTLMLSLMGSVAEFERSIILERQREGIAIAKAAGKYKGRKPSLTAKQVEELRGLAKAGVAKTKLARQFGIHRESVYRYLAAE